MAIFARMIAFKNRILATSVAFFALVGLPLLFPSCTTDFEVYAPEKEVRVVYCVLDPTDSIQYIRIAKAYQYEGDAFAYAADNDLSLRGLDVRVMGNGVTYTAFEIDSVPKQNGLFFPYQTVYAFYTDSLGPNRDKLKAGITYTLEVGTPDAPNYVTGTTKVPVSPTFTGDLRIQAGQGSTRCLPRLLLERDFQVLWQRGDAANFEFRIFFNYESAGNAHQIVFGPTDLFNTNKGCSQGGNTVCYKFQERALLNYFSGRMQGGAPYTYDTQDSCITPPEPLSLMPQSLIFEMTAVDSNLSDFMAANNPAFVDLTGAKPEWTNLTGSIDVVGVFGSINIARQAAIMSPCSTWLLGLNGIAQPPGCTP